MSNVRNYTDEEIIARVEGLSTFKGWKPGIYEINVRSDEDEYDAFDDKSYTYEVGADGKPEFVMSRKVTTNTGSYGLQKFKDYNPSGAAVLKSDWMVYGSHTFGNHPFRGGKPAYRQAKSWPYFRDNNKNKRAEEIGPEREGIIGANIHRAGVNSTVIKNWSTACIVTAVQADFLKFLKFMASKGNPPLNVAILKEFNPATTKKAAGNKVSATSSVKPANGDVTQDEADAQKDLSQSTGSPTDIVPPEQTQPAVTNTVVEQKTVESTPGGETTTTTTAQSVAAPVEVQKESPSWMVKIAAPFTALAGLGFNAASFIQTKLEEMTVQQIAYMVVALGLVGVAIYWWQKAAKAAQARTMQLVEKAADKDLTTVILVNKASPAPVVPPPPVTQMPNSDSPEAGQ